MFLRAEEIKIRCINESCVLVEVKVSTSVVLPLLICSRCLRWRPADPQLGETKGGVTKLWSIVFLIL